jgi:hypothetical protein
VKGSSNFRVRSCFFLYFPACWHVETETTPVVCPWISRGKILNKGMVKNNFRLLKQISFEYFVIRKTCSRKFWLVEKVIDMQIGYVCSLCMFNLFMNELLNYWIFVWFLGWSFKLLPWNEFFRRCASKWYRFDLHCRWPSLRLFYQHPSPCLITHL